MIVERMPWNKVHKIGIVKEFVSRTVNLSVRICRGNRVKSIIILVFGLNCSRYYTWKIWIRFQCFYLFLIVNNNVDFIVVDVSGDVELSVVGRDFGRDESGFVAVGDVEENVRSSVLVDEVEDDVRGTVGVGDVGSDGQIGLIFVGDVGCKSEVTIGVVEGWLEDDRAVFVVDGCVGGHRAVAVCHWGGEVDWTVLIADGEIVVDCSVVGGHFGGWDHWPVHWGHVGVWADSAVGGSNAAVGAEGAVRKGNSVVFVEGGVIEHSVGGFVERGVVQSGVGVGDEGAVVEWSGLVLVGGTVQQRSFVGLFEGGVDGCGVGPDNEGTVGEVVHWVGGNVGVVGSNWGRMVQSGVGGVGREGRGNVGGVRLDRLRNIGGGSVEVVDQNWVVEGSVGVVEGLLIGKAAIIGGFDGVVDCSVRVGEGLIVGHCSVCVVEADNVIHSSAVICRDIINNSSIIRVHNLIWVVQCPILTII